MITDEIKITAIDPHSKGGQHAGIRPMGMRVVHEPTGVVIEIPAEVMPVRSAWKIRQAMIDSIEHIVLEINR